MQAREFTVEPVEFAQRLDEIRSVRFAVFVEEQKVPAEIEMDAWDERSEHVLVFSGGKAIGTGRLLPDGHIGRIAVLADWRGSGVGKAIMESLMTLGRSRGMRRFELSAQTQARVFYERLGFRVSGEAYMEAGIEHVAMAWEE